MNADQQTVLAEIVYRHSGLKLDHVRQEEIFATVDLMKKTVGVPQVQDLFTKLESTSTHHPLWQMLLRRVTIGETYFFRNMSQYEALRTQILPAIIEQRRSYGLKHLNLWSAGCASGEEPYSLAILLHELLPDIETWTISLLATDINATSLESARKAVYREHSFRAETRPDIRERYFRKLENNTWELDAAIRKMVNFAPLNLISDHYPSFLSRTSHLDLIICRNVTIYFDADTTRGVVGRFHESLLDKGWLVVGHAEPLSDLYKGFVPRNFEGTVVYQKAPVEHVQSLNLDWSLENSAKSTKPTTAPLVAPPPAKPVTAPLVSPSPAKTGQLPALKPTYSLQDLKAVADRENWDQASEMLREMERSHTLNPAFHYWRGLVLMHKDELAEARQALRRSLYCDSQFSLAHYLLGDLAYQEGDVKEARRCWQRALDAVANRPADAHVIEHDMLTVDELRGLLQTRLHAGAI
jgi:chemotaxis protein methyltransferase CheR